MKTRILFFVALICIASSVYAVSISPGKLKELTESGEISSIVRADLDARERGVWQPNATPFKFGLATDVDTLHCLIILVDFSDMPHEIGFHAEPPNFDTLLFSMGIRNPGSMADFYDETSYGQAFLTGQVTNWYRMPQTYAYYVDGQRGFGEYPHNAQRLTEDAVIAADPDIDFSLYDNDGDGWVDALFVVHAGPGYEDTGNLNYIHSHAWVTSYQMNVDGVRVYSYSMEPEETGSHHLVTIGVFCHEFGHVLGLPDLYDYDYDSQGVGGWSVMAGGSWGGGGAIPVHFDGWSRYQLGWAIPETPIDNMTHVQIDAIEYSPDLYQLYSGGAGDQEYFLVENRRQRLFDVSVPGSGLLIYHIDEAVPDNNDQTHYKVAVEQADGMYDLEHNQGADDRDPWPGTTDHRMFDDFSVPDAWYYGTYGPSEVSVSNISDSDSVMFADLGVYYVDPLYQILDVSFDDSTGNSNGRPEGGETCEFIFTAQNVRASANDLTVTLTCDDESVMITDSLSVFGPLPLNTPFDNSADPFVFSLPPGFSNRYVTFTLILSASGGSYVQEIDHVAILGIPDLLLVDDDAGADIDSFYTDALFRIRKPFDVWDISLEGSPAGVISSYDQAIWFTGDTRPDAMLPEHVSVIISYLNGGGHLMITSQDFVQQLSERNNLEDSILLNEYLKADYDRLEYEHHPTGAPGTVFDSLVYLTSGVGGGNNQNSQDALFALPGGIPVMTYRTARTAAVAVISSYTALTLGFGAEGVNPTYAPTYDSLHTLIDAALRLFAEPQDVKETAETLPDKMSLAQNYPNPFNPSTQIEFEISAAGSVKLEIFDLLGRLVDRPVDGIMPAGKHEVTWNGSERPSGIYFYRLLTSTGTSERRMTLLK